MWFLGVTSEVRVCDCCGRRNLKRTVAFESYAGDIVYYGASCAQRHSGRDIRTLERQRRGFEEQSVWLAEQESDYQDAMKRFAIALAEAERRWPVETRRANRAVRDTFAWYVRKASDAKRRVRDVLIRKHLAVFKAAIDQGAALETRH